MKFRTEISIKASSNKISHSSNTLLMGSCFAESIGEKLEYFKLPVLVNPCGILFNPVSIANAFRFICNKTIFTEHDLIQYDGLWHSFFHHGSFSNANNQNCLTEINRNISDANAWIKNTSTIIITLGTAYVWEHRSSKTIVSNCHKIPSTEFNHFMLSVADVERSLQSIIENIKSLNPEVTVIFTVSPIRYLNHGAHQSQLSKATLLLAVDNIQKLQMLRQASNNEGNDTNAKMLRQAQHDESLALGHHELVEVFSSICHSTSNVSRKNVSTQQNENLADGHPELVEGQTNNPNIEYFPSYEIMMDDLRDYRFYAEDLVHPTSQAVDYIWGKFSDCYFTPETIELNKKIDAYQKALHHKVMNPESQSGQKFKEHITQLRNNLGKMHPFLNL